MRRYTVVVIHSLELERFALSTRSGVFMSEGSGESGQRGLSEGSGEFLAITHAAPQ